MNEPKDLPHRRKVWFREWAAFSYKAHKGRNKRAEEPELFDQLAEDYLKLIDRLPTEHIEPFLESIQDGFPLPHQFASHLNDYMRTIRQPESRPPKEEASPEETAYIIALCRASRFPLNDDLSDGLVRAVAMSAVFKRFNKRPDDHWADIIKAASEEDLRKAKKHYTANKERIPKTETNPGTQERRVVGFKKLFDETTN